MSMSPKASKEVKRILWIFVGSFFLMPALLWFLVVGILKRDYQFPGDYLEFYHDLFTLRPDMVLAWLILSIPVVIYELAVTCHYYCKHPEEFRSIFKFPRRDRR